MRIKSFRISVTSLTLKCKLLQKDSSLCPCVTFAEADVGLTGGLGLIVGLEDFEIFLETS